MTTPSVPQSAVSTPQRNGRRTALYARASIVDHQEPETQLAVLRDYCASQELEIFEEYVDVGQDRPELDRLMEHARQRRFDAVTVTRLDRFARSIRHLATALEEINALGVDFISLSESIDTSTPEGQTALTVIGAVADMERALTRERVAMGLQRVKATGKKLGRPRVQVSKQRLKALRDAGLSVRKIAAKLGIGKSKVAELLKKLEE